MKTSQSEANSVAELAATPRTSTSREYRRSYWSTLRTDSVRPDALQLAIETATSDRMRHRNDIVLDINLSPTMSDPISRNCCRKTSSASTNHTNNLPLHHPAKQHFCSYIDRFAVYLKRRAQL